MILLVAVLDRVSWKYGDPNAYRVVMIEAGHIAQNIMLACTANDLTACPTAALNHSEISSILGLESITQSPVYALLVGKPGPNEDQLLSVETVLGGGTQLN
jgi:SagB-type dehydrogenase family enzyme